MDGAAECFIGRRVSKMFARHGRWEGTVVSVRTEEHVGAAGAISAEPPDLRMWTVLYDAEGGDEEFTTAELKRFLKREERAGGSGSAGGGGASAERAGGGVSGAVAVAPKGAAKIFAKRPAPAKAPTAKRSRPAAVALAPPLALLRPRAEPAEADPLSVCCIDMHGAAVDTAALPAFRPGPETRTLGQTLSRGATAARTHAVAAWKLRPPDARPWAEVLSPSDADDKKSIVAALRDFLGLPRGQELLSALPVDPPCSPHVEAYTVAADDPRVGLRGQAGARVRPGGPALTRHTVLGTYRALTMTSEEYQQYRFTGEGRVALPNAAATAAALAAAASPAQEDDIRLMAEMENELLFESFAGDYTHWERRSTSFTPPQPKLVTSAYGFGNLTCLINDAYGPGFDEDEPDGGAAINVKLVEVLVHGWPAIFAITTREVPPGTELLMSYGHFYWENLRVVAKRLMQARLRRDATLPAQQGSVPPPPEAEDIITGSAGSGGGTAGASGDVAAAAVMPQLPAAAGTGAGFLSRSNSCVVPPAGVAPPITAAVQQLPPLPPPPPPQSILRPRAASGGGATPRSVRFAETEPTPHAGHAFSRDEALREAATEGQAVLAAESGTAPMAVDDDAMPATAADVDDDAETAMAADAAAIAAQAALEAALDACGADDAAQFADVSRLAHALAVCKAHALARWLSSAAPAAAC